MANAPLANISLKKAETIIGRDVGEWDGKFWTEIPGHGLIGHESLGSLVGENYRIVKAQVFADQKWRCIFCGGIKPLQADHIESRGRHGRCDAKDNLRGVCDPCHRMRHSGGIKES